MGLLSRAARALVGASKGQAPLTRIYRGIVPDNARRSALGDRWWSSSPEVASSYAPSAAEGAHVLPGMIDENSMRMLHIDAPPGTMFRSIPVHALPPKIRRAFSRSTETVSTHEVAAAAEAMGYQGVTFRGIRDGGYGGAAQTYGGFESGDPGRVIALFDPENSVRSPFAWPPKN